jgi:hypothetical protein
MLTHSWRAKPPEIRDVVIRINTESSADSPSGALFRPIVAGLIGLLNSFR